MIDIKDISGRIRYSTGINSGAKGKFTLMKEDYIVLPFSVQEPVYFKLGDYVDMAGVLDDALGGKLAKIYQVVEIQKPTYNTRTAGYDYDLRLDAYYMAWRLKKLKYTPEGGAKEASFSLTAPLDVHLGVFLRNLKALGFTYSGVDYGYSIDSTVSTGAISLTYDNVNLIDALTMMAEAAGCEWWVTDNYIHFGRYEFGDAVKIELGIEASDMTRSESKGTYATRIYVFGSTKNIPEDYRPVDSEMVVNGVVQKRLMLPEGTPYLDAYEGMPDEEAVEDIVVFDDIYPRKTGTMTDVTTRESAVDNGDGTQSTATLYRYRDTGLTFLDEYILEGQELRIQFKSGKMNGMEFGVIFDPDDDGSQLWEIVRNDSYGRMLPDDVLCPEDGDEYYLSGFDIRMVSDLYVPEAERELLERGKEYLARTMVDDGTYPVTLYSGWVYDDQIARTFDAGQRILLVNPAFFPDGGRQSRVIGWEMRLDYPWDSPVYTIGESSQYSRIGELEDKVESITYKGQTYTGGGSGGGVYVIRVNDSTAPSDSNVFSALRSRTEFLSKKNNDTANGVILFAKKIGSSVFVDGWEGKGWEIRPDGGAWLGSANVRDSLFVGNRMGSPLFVSGFPNGVGWDLSPYKQLNAAGAEETKWRLEIDDINVRGRLRVYEFIISQLRGENDNVIFAGMMKVDHYDEATRRIYLDTDEGVLYNPFRPGDILMVQRYGGMPTEENDYNVIKQYELRVDQAEVGDLSEGEKRLDWITFTNFVGTLSDIARGDVLTRVDSVTDLTRKGIVKVTTIDEIGAPYIDVVYGMKTDPENATKARMGNLTGIRTKSGIDLTGIWGIYGNGAYFENSTYILDTGNTIEQQFSIMNGEFVSQINAIRTDISEESGNLLRNGSFASDTNYWTASNEIHYIDVGGQFLWLGGAFYVDKTKVADIVSDSGRNVLRVRNTSIYQANDVMMLPKREDTEEDGYTYSFSLFYRATRSGILKVGIYGSELYQEIDLDPEDNYTRLTHVAKWNEKGDFRIECSGEVYVYGVVLYDDATADAIIKLETRVEQTEEYIKLLATKDYVDEETGEIYKKYDAEISVMAEEIGLRVTYEEYKEGSSALEKALESKISVEAGRITAVSEEVDGIRGTIASAGWITASDGNILYASKSLENGDEIISYINQTATTLTISASRVNLNGAVTINSLGESLKQTINGKVNSSDIGDMAYKDEVSYSYLDVWLREYLDGKVSPEDLAEYVLTTDLNSKLTGYEKVGAAEDVQDYLINILLNGTTTILGGYISTSLINADWVVANAASIGGFTIQSDRLTSNRMSLIPSTGLLFSNTGLNTDARIGSNVLPATSATACCVYAKNTRYSGGLYTNGMCAYFAVGDPAYYEAPQKWIVCEQEVGYGASFTVEARTVGESSGISRTFIKAGHLPTKAQLEKFGQTISEYTLKYDSNSGIFYI